MSGFIGAAMPVNLIAKHDLRLWRMDLIEQGTLFADVWAVAPSVFMSEYWPRSGFMGDYATDVAMCQPVAWGRYDQAAGSASRFGFVGVTRDSLGSPIGGCTVLLFRTSDNVLQDTTTSDTNGSFLLNTAYYPDAHFLVVRKAGTPNVSGATDGTQVAT